MESEPPLPAPVTGKLLTYVKICSRHVIGVRRPEGPRIGDTLRKSDNSTALYDMQLNSTVADDYVRRKIMQRRANAVIIS